MLVSLGGDEVWSVGLDLGGFAGNGIKCAEAKYQGQASFLGSPSQLTPSLCLSPPPGAAICF